jgi:hypothetical protein
VCVRGATKVATSAANMVAGGDDDCGGNGGTDTGEMDPTATKATSSSPAPPPPPGSTIDWEKYHGLGGWVSRMRGQIERYQKAATRKSSILTGEQVKRLLDVGFVMDPRRNRGIRPTRFGWRMTRRDEGVTLI